MVYFFIFLILKEKSGLQGKRKSDSRLIWQPKSADSNQFVKFVRQKSDEIGGIFWILMTPIQDREKRAGKKWKCLSKSFQIATLEVAIFG